MENIKTKNHEIEATLWGRFVAVSCKNIKTQKIVGAATFDIENSKFTNFEDQDSSEIASCLRCGVKHYVYDNKIKLNLVRHCADDNCYIIYTDNLNRFYIDSPDGFMGCTPDYFEPVIKADKSRFNIVN
jgi:hypothetical protein